ncbi:uncharacterized protein [Aquarana catesbeiana]|uniref:uncharacterized protein isoform X2 n=1 Tax=Aquarana catesbeiana TaxID=8400 RepID=UPI003CC98E55
MHSEGIEDEDYVNASDFSAQRIEKIEKRIKTKGRFQDEDYVNSSDFSAQRIERIEKRTKTKELPAAGNPQSWVVITLVILLILMFIILVIFTSLLFVFYNSITDEQSHLKNNVKELTSQLKNSELKINKNFTGEVQHLKHNIRQFTLQLRRYKEETNSGLKRDVSGLQESGLTDPTCSMGWAQYGQSCYYVSSNSLPWSASKKDCEDKKAHLVVINDQQEMNFLRGISKVSDLWIGLTDADGTWKWVDGTPYGITPKFWESNQPDDWTGHGLGGGEDCVELRGGHEWNDDHCSQRYKYICEKKVL